MENNPFKSKKLFRNNIISLSIGFMRSMIHYDIIQHYYLYYNEYTQEEIDRKYAIPTIIAILFTYAAVLVINIYRYRRAKFTDRTEKIIYWCVCIVSMLLYFHRMIFIEIYN